MILRTICFGVCSIVAMCLVYPSEAANKTPASTTDGVQELLQSEIQSANGAIDRRDTLRPGVRPQADSNAAFWQSGYVQTGKQWLRFEDTIAEGADALRLSDYMEHREAYLKRPNGQVQLANWCRKNGLIDQERVHLLHALAAQDPTLKADLAYQRLGCQKVGGVWVSPYERREAAELTAEIEQSHRRWDSKFQAIKQLLGGSLKQRAAAEKQMSRVTHVSAVPAIVDTFSMADQSSAELGIRMLGQISEYQASRALAGQAVFSPWRPVRMSAAEMLKTRKFEEFVPDLLLLLAKPIKTKLKIAARREDRNVNDNRELDWRTDWDFVWIEESPNTIRVGIRRLFPISVPSVLDRQTQRNLMTRDDYTQIAIAELKAQTEMLDYSAEKMNEFRTDMNDRVTGILAKSTDQPKSDDPNEWWNWWTTYSNMDVPTQKAVVVVDERKNQPNLPSLSTQRPHSCLVAGTPVWTERGSIPVEQILPGDRVLSKDIDSGEVGYKPVLLSTVREPTPVQQFRVADETIVASPGHHFWVSGDGWTKVRNLTPQRPLHTVTGMQRILSTEDDGRVESVYNLVVADFHTYFVGKTMILSHDVTTPRLTNAKVPGLAVE